MPVVRSSPHQPVPSPQDFIDLGRDRRRLTPPLLHTAVPERDVAMNRTTKEHPLQFVFPGRGTGKLVGQVKGGSNSSQDPAG